MWRVYCKVRNIIYYVSSVVLDNMGRQIQYKSLSLLWGTTQSSTEIELTYKNGVIERKFIRNWKRADFGMDKSCQRMFCEGSGTWRTSSVWIGKHDCATMSCQAKAWG